MKDFLTAFKEFENEIRNNTQYSSVKEYEDSIENTDVQDKIRFLRIIRNYYSHHSDGEILVKINKSSIDFLEKQTQLLLNSKLKVKDKYKSISKSQKIVKQSDIYSLINMLCKKNILSAYIIDKNSYLLGEIALPDLISKYFEFNRLVKSVISRRFNQISVFHFSAVRCINKYNFSKAVDINFIGLTQDNRGFEVIFEICVKFIFAVAYFCVFIINCNNFIIDNIVAYDYP